MVLSQKIYQNIVYQEKLVVFIFAYSFYTIHIMVEAETLDLATSTAASGNGIQMSTEDMKEEQVAENKNVADPIVAIPLLESINEVKAEFPSGITLSLVIIALLLALFLVALDMVSFT